MTTPVTWLPGMDITAGRLAAMQQAASLLATNYGADGSGTANANPGIQEALNIARDLGGAQVVVPPGVYLIGATLRIYSNTRLTLMKGAEFRRNVAGTMIINGDAGQAFGGYTGHSRIVIEGGLWNMRGTTGGLTGSAMCISIGHATDIVIRDLEVRDLPGFHAIELNSTTHGTISGCQFRGYVDPGGRDFSEAVQLDLAKSADVFGGFGPYDHTPCEDVLVTGCHFGASGTAGTTAWPRGVGSHSATITKYHRRIRISDCSFEGTLQYAVSAYNWEDFTCTGNTFVSCGSGVRLRTVIVADTEDTKLPDGTQTSASQSMRNLSVVGNTFRSGGGYDEPIVALGETTGQVLNLTVAGNAIDGSTTAQNGIRLQRVERSSVTGNAVANSAGTGISMENCSRVIVDANQVTWAGGHGVTSVTCTQMTVSNNQIMFPDQNGMLIQAGQDIQVRGNFVKGPGRITNATYYGVRLSTAVNSVSLSGNKCRGFGSGNEAINGFSATNTCDAIARYGNDWRGSWTGANMDDLSDAPTTTATDLS
ncbi:right-handed parallel beta-helix repeat-containing protein [Streptomyces phaeochromogenes]